MESYLEKGYKCFLVRDVPQYALREEVEVVTALDVSWRRPKKSSIISISRDINPRHLMR